MRARVFTENVLGSAIRLLSRCNRSLHILSRGTNQSVSFKQKNPYLTPKVRIPRAGSWKTMSNVGEKQASPKPSALVRPIVWIDCEMTGLDHVNDHIIEICCLITDGDLNLVDEGGYESVIHCEKEKLDAMDSWCVEHHGSSGLTHKVLESTKTTQQVEQELLAYLQKYIPEPRQGVLAGNSVHMDRVFMMREFPKVINHLFYRIIDVSTIMEVSFRHNAELASVFPRKKSAHTARSDILESIQQLKWYQDHYLKSSAETRHFVDERKQQIAIEESKSVTDTKITTISATPTASAPAPAPASAPASAPTRPSTNDGNPSKKQRLG